MKEKISALKEYPGNPRRGDLKTLKQSLEMHGQYRPIVVRKETREVLAGNHILKAAAELGWEEVEIYEVENLTDEAAAKIVLVDNRASELGSMDQKALFEMLAEIPELDGTAYTEDDFYELLSKFGDDFQSEVDEDTIPEDDPANIISKKGQIWKLGDHRLIVGDATNPEDYKKLMGGKVADMILTDPPYNVSYEGGDSQRGNGNGLKIENDTMSNPDFYDFLLKFYRAAAGSTKPGGAIYVWHATVEATNFTGAMKDGGFLYKQTLTWVKNYLVLSRQDYHWITEPCLYGWKPGAAHTWNADRKQSTAIDDAPDFSKMTKEQLLEHLAIIYGESEALRFDKPQSAKIHPTMKPVELFAYQIKNSSKHKQIVLDPFMGSGTTFIAAHKTNRIAYGMEFDPFYADRILRRFQEYTGIMPILEETGESHDFRIAGDQ